MTGAASGSGDAMATAFIEAGAFLCDLSAKTRPSHRGPRSPLATCFDNAVTVERGVCLLAHAQGSRERIIGYCRDLGVTTSMQAESLSDRHSSGCGRGLTRLTPIDNSPSHSRTDSVAMGISRQ